MLRFSCETVHKFNKKMSNFNCCIRNLVLPYINNGKNIRYIDKYIRKNYKLSDENMDRVLSTIKKSVIPKCNKRWQKAKRFMQIFLEQNEEWLSSNISISLPASGKLLNVKGKRGRPITSYDQLSTTMKRRKNISLVKENGIEHLFNAYIQDLRSKGEGDEAKIVELLRSYSKEKKHDILKTLEEPTHPFNELETLGIFIDLDLTKAQYIYLRNILLEKRCSVFPPYYKLQEAKKSCYPSPLQISDTCAKVKYLQDILDHTATRILMIESPEKNDCNSLTLYSKYGCDGSSGQAEYKQVLSEESIQVSDANLFIASLVPLRLINNETNAIIWQNPAPSSVRFCRPILIEFCKETPAKTKEVVEDIKRQIKSLLPTKIIKNEISIKIKHDLFPTMIDGKVAQVLTDTASCSTCTICKAKPTDMNDISKVTARQENKDAFQYGLSTLHAWIRCMDMILHISYNLEFKKWSASTEDQKRVKQEKKQTVQKRFREELGLHIDKPRHGSGNSNDGNTARRFFFNSTCSANITGVDETLIKRLHIVLQTLSSGMMIDSQKFGEYALETAKCYIKNYYWYYMPSSVHKILIHGKSIINHFGILPIGQLSEDAQESRNKDYKKYRLHHSRKCSRAATNEDVFHRLLYTSDPFITSLRKPSLNQVKDFDDDALELFDSSQSILMPRDEFF